MPDSNGSSLDSYFNVVSSVIFCFSCMVHLLVIQMRIFGKNFIDDCIIFLKRAIEILLLYEVKSNCFVPVEVANGLKESLILLRREDLQSKEDKSNTKERKLLLNFIVDFIKCLDELAFVMIFHKVAFAVVLIQGAEKSTEFDSFIAVFDEFE
jgi:hypothetical protein